MKRILTHNLLETADKFPDRLAFKQLENSITYQALIAKANQLANLLSDIGVRQGDRIAIFMNRSFESAVSVYGVLLAGAAYVPIDSNSPEERTINIINDCGIKVLISNPSFSEKLATITEMSSTLVYVVGTDNPSNDLVRNFSWSDVDECSENSPTTSSSENDLAYIIYTSGTTGKPKGIMHSHYSGASYAKLSAELYQLTEKDILGNHSHLHYDISTLGYLTVPYVGACTVIVPTAHTIFPTSMGNMIAKEEMTIWYSVPLAIIQMLESGSFKSEDFSKLRWILFGGEPFTMKHLKELVNLLPNASFSNVYGPAEVNQCTYYNFDRNTKLNDPLPLGNVWNETFARIKKESNQDETGELMIASSTQMQGYWNKEELNKKCFVEEELSDGPKRRYYLTGDVVKHDNEGNLIFLGRTDRQVKVRGHRVELNEIESILQRNSYISDAAVIAKKIDEGLEVHAMLIMKDETIDEKNILKYLAQHLPSHALPTKIIKVDFIPRTDAGKVDYKALSI